VLPSVRPLSIEQWGLMAPDPVCLDGQSTFLCAGDGRVHAIHRDHPAEPPPRFRTRN
jgi:hypothetical protein